MALKTYNPTTPSQRQLVNIDRSSLYKGPPVKALTEGQHSHGGRNNTGRITSRFRGGGHKQAYRKIDFRRTKVDMPATVERLEYDPNRTAYIALVKYQDDVPEDAIVNLNIPTGMPLVYELDDKLKPLRSYYLGDAEKVKAAMEAVAAQGKKK